MNLYPNKEVGIFPEAFNLPLFAVWTAGDQITKRESDFLRVSLDCWVCSHGQAFLTPMRSCRRKGESFSAIQSEKFRFLESTNRESYPGSKLKIPKRFTEAYLEEIIFIIKINIIYRSY